MTANRRRTALLAGSALSAGLVAVTLLILKPPEDPWVWVERGSWVAALAALALTAVSGNADRRPAEQPQAAAAGPVAQQSIFQAGRDVHQIGSVHLGTPANDHGFLLPFSLVTTIGMVACVAIVAVVHLRPAKSSTARRPYVITVQAGAEVDTTNGGAPAAVVFPQGLPRAVEPQPAGQCEDWYSWGKTAGGVDYFHTFAAFTVSAVSSAVRVHSARVKREPLKRRAAGEYPSCPIGQPPVTSYLSVDLDAGKVSYFYPAPAGAPIDGMTAGGLLARPFALEVTAGKSDRVLVEGFTDQCFCSWWLELDVEVDGVRYTERVDDHGRPFVTAPKSGKYVGLSWSAERSRWCGPPDDC
ncbi:hypothetical protein AB0J83_40495 [Actinoplanes sp. NPDC049596]|uniref:hypothetical protein n=1 Tax=unclassified Actinoplanes TaxID=2626549 RepID=UPI00342D1F6E